MDVAITIVMLVPILLAVALIISVIRKNVTERQAGDPVDIGGAIPAVIVLMVAVLVIVAMGNAASPYVWDEDGGELTIQQNVPELDVQPWDSYASDVKSLVIEDGVTSIGVGAFDTLTGLEYVAIPEGAEIAEGAFPFDFVDPYGEPSSAAGRFAVYDGSAWLSDPGLYRLINTSELNGFASGVTGVKVAALPTQVNGITITGVADRAFRNNADLVFVTDFPDSRIVRTGTNSFTADTSLLEVRLSALTSIGNFSFQNCAALAEFDGPSVVTLGNYAFIGTAIVSADFPKATSVGMRCYQNCTTLESFSGPSVTALENDAIGGCSALARIDLASVKTMGSGAMSAAAVTAPYLPELETIGNYALQNSAITTIHFPKVTTIGTRSFNGCVSIEEVSFGPSLETVASDSFNSWTFYESDGTTQIDKTVAANLAGKTFQGTAAALVEVSDGQLSLTPQQLQQVQLHNQELQDLKDRLTIDPLPFQPSVQTQDQEPVSA